MPSAIWDWVGSLSLGLNGQWGKCGPFGPTPNGHRPSETGGHWRLLQRTIGTSQVLRMTRGSNTFYWSVQALSLQNVWLSKYSKVSTFPIHRIICPRFSDDKSFCGAVSMKQTMSRPWIFDETWELLYIVCWVCGGVKISVWLLNSN